MYKGKRATVFGGTGFLGKHIVKRLADLGMTVVVATRVPERAAFLKPCGQVGQVVPVACDRQDIQSINDAVRGSDYVVNCIGILFEKGKKARFKQVHVDMASAIAQACAAQGVQRFVHISALGCDKATSHYAKTKREGEQAVLSHFPSATILRPCVIFGPDDQFFNTFAEMSRYVPCLPLIGGGKTRFQPVFVGDVAQAAQYALVEPSGQYEGKIYCLGGPDQVSFREIYKILFTHTGRSVPLLSLPFAVAKGMALFFGILPHPPLTRDQVESLKTDNIVEGGAQGFDAFGITPKAMALVLPEYLERYRFGGVFSQQKEGEYVSCEA